MWAIIFVGQFLLCERIKKIVNKGKEIFGLHQASQTLSILTFWQIIPTDIPSVFPQTSRDEHIKIYEILMRAIIFFGQICFKSVSKKLLV
jgi:hypothetical protein